MKQLSALMLLAGLTAGLSAAPQVTRTADTVTLRNDHLQVTVRGDNGGALADLRTADGVLLSSGHALYTDQGPFGAGVYVGTGPTHATPVVTVDGDRVRVRSEGFLATRDGATAQTPGRMEYFLEYELGTEPVLSVRWGATPAFSADKVTGFFAYVGGLPNLVGLFADTIDGVLLQDPATQNGRSYQSSIWPLSPEHPWFGVLRQDGIALAFCKPTGTPPLPNCFFHEDGKGAASFFLAWLNGGAPQPLEAGKAWTGQCEIRVAPSFERLRRDLP
jgi:hypothetical protein